METLDRGWRRIVCEIGVEFILPEARRDLPRGRLQDRGRERLPRPRLRARAGREGAARVRRAGPQPGALRAHRRRQHGVLGASTGRRSCARATSAATRRWTTSSDFTMLAQSFDELDSAGGTICEPNDTPARLAPPRHGVRAADAVRQALHGLRHVRPERGRHDPHDRDPASAAREAIERAPATISLINVNSPLRFDDRMLAAMFEYNRANQAVIITPFLLMGAMSPVTIPATLVQQMAEALAGIALTQLVRPGCPVIFGSFLSNTDMQSGSPSFGTPESAIGLLCTGQIARRFGLPWRSGGGLTSSQTVDAQAAYEALMTMLPTFLAGANYVMHSAGWLESGLVSCYEKFIVDIEILRMLQVEFTPLEIDEASLAFGAHQEVGHGGHFLGAEHTLERFRTCFYRPLLSSTENFERWKSKGSRDATERAGEIWRKTLESLRAAGASTRTSGRSSRSTSTGAGSSSGTDDAAAACAEHGPARHRDGVRGAGPGEGARGDRQARDPSRDRRAGLRHARPHRRGGHARAARRPHPLLPGARPAGAARGVRRPPVRPPRPRHRPGPRRGRARRKAVPLLRRARHLRPRRRGDLPQPRLPDLRVGDPLRGRDAGAAAAASRSAGSRSRPPTWPSGSRRARGS